MKFLQRWKQTALHNKALVLTGVLVAAGTLFYAGAAVFQIYLMNYSAKQATVQTERMINEADRIADSIERSFEQSKKSLDASMEMLRRDQRAWVGPVKVMPAWRDPTNKPIFIKEGFAPQFEVVITNSGKSPAGKVRIWIKFDTIPAAREFFPNYGLPQKQSVAVIQPQQISSMPVSAPQPISAVGIDNIQSRKSILYLFGKITYEDIFNTQHSTTFCMTLATSLDAFNSCDAHNDAD